MGSLKPHHNWKHYGSVNGIPTVGKNNLLPRGGKVANTFFYHDVDQARTSTPSQTNPNVMFYRRSSSVMASNRSFNHLRNSNRHIGSTSNAQLFWTKVIIFVWIQFLLSFHIKNDPRNKYVKSKLNLSIISITVYWIFQAKC